MAAQHDRDQPVVISPLGLEGTLGLPGVAPKGLVIFAHGSGSSRFSPRNNYVAKALRQTGLATLLFDLLTGSEAADRANVFDIALLAQRLVAATRWARGFGLTRMLPVDYFGASTGAAAALVAAARHGSDIAAIVSRGGRPISPARRWRMSRRRPCWSWAATISTSSRSIARRLPCCVARPGWRSSRGLLTSSRSLARSRPWSSSRRSGSSATGNHRPNQVSELSSGRETGGSSSGAE